MRTPLALRLMAAVLLTCPFAACTTTPDTLLLKISSEPAGTDAPLTHVRVLFTDGVQRWPADATGSDAVFQMEDGFTDPSRASLALGISPSSPQNDAPGQHTFAEAVVSVQVTGWAAERVATAWEGTVNLTRREVVTVRLLRVGDDCDDDDDGFLSALSDGCAPAGSLFGDCAPDHGASNPWWSGPERCDGIDNDCDGAADEDFEALGALCDDDDEDQCALGQWACAADGLDVTCAGDEAQVESCNGDDDDCDGVTDETFPEAGAACDDEDDDLCAVGTLTCVDGLVTCEGDEDTPEDCNDLDDDCDGETDEGLEDALWGCPHLGVCAEPGAVAAACVDGAWSCSILTGDYDTDEFTRCDGLDNDCDGATDEDHPVGQPCDGEDTDACANGAWICAPNGLGVVCPAESISDIAESCDGSDDDCDGQTDEDFALLGQPCDGDDADQCEFGTWTCGDTGASEVCVNETTFKPELCNGFDDDCDGVTDNGFEDLGALCDGDDGDMCKTGIYTCSADQTSLACLNETIEDKVETCNGSDDDCDGLTDEDFEVGDPCDGDDDDLCVQGILLCTPAASVPQCIESESFVEVCNGLDDDCDGLTDEGFDVGAPCDSDDDDLCALGTISCNQLTGDASCVEEITGIAENCNTAADDDCDGETNEGC